MKCTGALAMLAVAACLFGGPAQAQQTAPAPFPTDLNGLWTNESLTNLTRPAGVARLVVTPEEAARIVANTSIAGFAPEGAPTPEFSDPNAPPPAAGASDFGVRAYDQFWVSPGDRLAVVKGEIRSSYIVDPPNGQVPLRPDAEVLGLRTRLAGRYVTGVGGNEGPEALPYSERCLIGFGNTGGPGMLSTLYNNTYQIVQAPDHVVILVEMVHDARIIPTFASKEIAVRSHKPEAIPKWLGDSVGWYEGATLVVQTRNFHPEQVRNGSVSLSASGTLTERFTRVSQNEIFYEFTIDDPANYTQPWKAELSFHPAQGGLWEYACHEGNHSVPGILLGARLQEMAASPPAPRPRR